MKNDIPVATVIGLFTILYIGLVSMIPMGTANSPGPGLFPMTCGLLMFALTLLYLIRSIRQAKFQTYENTAKSGWREYKPLLLMAASLLFFGLALDYLGFLISTAILMLINFLALGYKKSSALILAIVVTIVAYVVFGVGLKIPLPKFFL